MTKKQSVSVGGPGMLFNGTSMALNKNVLFLVHVLSNLYEVFNVFRNANISTIGTTGSNDLIHSFCYMKAIPEVAFVRLLASRQ